MGEAKRRQLAGKPYSLPPRRVYIEKAGYVFQGNYWHDLKDAETGQLIDSMRYKDSLESKAERMGWIVIEKPEGNDE